MKRIVQGVRTVVLFATLATTSIASSAQSNPPVGKYEVGFSFGPLFFLGDLGGNAGNGTAFLKDVNVNVVNISKGVHAQMNLTQGIGVRLGLNHGRLEAYDSVIVNKGTDERFRKQRNLQFRTDVFEAQVGLEIYPFQLNPDYYNNYGRFRPYAFVGIGGFKFNPKGQYIAPNGNTKWVELKPLRLEGQGMKEYAGRTGYALVQTEIPMAIGFKYFLQDNMYCGMEVMHRTTFTDYIDDVSTTYIDQKHFDTYLSAEDAVIAKQLYYRSNLLKDTPTATPYANEQRGNPKNNDSFFSTVVRFGWQVTNVPAAEKYGFHVLCPTFF